MLSARALYNPEVEFYRRSERGMSLSLSQASCLPEPYDTNGDYSHRSSPPIESEGKAGAARKRVPVACERCRKRKIKCSGNDSSRGCSNCRNAGYDACQFLRVQSTQMMLAAPSQRVWPSSHRYSPYVVPSTSRASYLPTQQQGFSNALPYNGYNTTLEYNEIPSNSHTPSYTRTPYPPGYSVGFEVESPTTHYVQQPPDYMLPPTDPMASLSTGYLGIQFGRSQPASVYCIPSDHMCAMPSTASHLLPTTYQMTASEPATAFHSTNTLSPPTDRTLPTPSTTRGLSSLDSLPMTAYSHRSSIGWGSADAISSSISGSSSSRASGSTSQESGAHRTASSCPSATTTTDIPFGYIGISHSPREPATQTLPLVVPQPSSTTFNDTTMTAESLHSPQLRNDQEVSIRRASELPLRMQRCKTVSQEDLALSPTSSQNTSYSYSTGSSMRRRSGPHHYGSMSVATGHLLNGQEYRRVSHRDSNNATVAYAEEGDAMFSNEQQRPPSMLRAAGVEVHGSPGY